MMRSSSPTRNHDGTCVHSGCSPEGSTSASWVAGALRRGHHGGMRHGPLRSVSDITVSARPCSTRRDSFERRGNETVADRLKRARRRRFVGRAAELEL